MSATEPHVGFASLPHLITGQRTWDGSVWIQFTCGGCDRSFDVPNVDPLDPGTRVCPTCLHAAPADVFPAFAAELERDARLERYPVETLSEEDDDGTMPENVAALEKAVIGRRIVNAEKTPDEDHSYGRGGDVLVLTLDNGTRAKLRDTSDCCAFTHLEGFLLNPAGVDHAITGVGTTEGFTKWHIYADFGDVVRMDVSWSCGNPFYYGYGFDIAVEPVAAIDTQEGR